MESESKFSGVTDGLSKALAETAIEKIQSGEWVVVGIGALSTEEAKRIGFDFDAAKPHGVVAFEIVKKTEEGKADVVHT